MLVAQTPHNNARKTPEGTRALFLQAAKVNGLHGDHLKPWHIKYSYEFLGVSGKPIDRGTIEELWAGPKIWKLMIVGRTSKLDYVRTKEGVYREGELDQKMALLMLLAHEFQQPIGFSGRSLANLHLTLQTRTIGSLQLRCFSLKTRYGVPNVFDDPAYCLGKTLPVVRIGSFAEDPHQFVLNHIGTFEGRYLPMDIMATEGGKPDLTAHMVLLQQISDVASADFKPSPDAVLQQAPQYTLIISELDFDRMIKTGDPNLHVISRPQPKYPVIAQAAHVHGTVTMRAMIGTDGYIAALRVITGPEMLRQAALDAVWKWRFEAPHHNGRPTRILTVISVKF